MDPGACVPTGVGCSVAALYAAIFAVPQPKIASDPTQFSDLCLARMVVTASRPSPARTLHPVEREAVLSRLHEERLLHPLAVCISKPLFIVACSVAGEARQAILRWHSGGFRPLSRTRWY